MTEHRQHAKAVGAGPDRAADAAFRASRSAHEQAAREEAERQLLELGQLLENSAVPEAVVSQSLLARALDAYAAAEKVLDHTDDIADIAGALVLVRMGRAAAIAAETGRTEPQALLDLCFFNPLHGLSARHVRWRRMGQREALVVRACAECADRIHQRRQPDALTCRARGHEVPYYEVDPSQSVWAATGYGQFADDLIERVLTGNRSR